MPTFVNRGKNVFRDPTDPELPNLDPGQITAPESRDMASGAPTDDTSKEFVMSEDDASSRKTLGLKDTSDAEAPALNKKGRGWKISDKRLDELHDRAREMKRFASPANKALAKRFADADLGRYTFKRFAVVGSAIVDFNCHNLGMAIMIDEEDQDETLAKRRDKSLESVGIRVMRIKATDILENMDAVLQRITAGMRMRIADKKEAARAHREANPHQNYSRPNRRTPDNA